MRLWWGYNWRRLLGGALFTFGFCITVNLVMRSSLTVPPTASENVAYVVIATIFQGSAVYLFNQNGKPDASHAGAAVRRLVRLAERAGALRRDAKASHVDDGPGEAKRKMGILAAQLEYLAIDALDSVEDWTTFNSDARKKLREIEKEL